MRVLLAGCWDEGPGFARTRSLEQALAGVDGIEVDRLRVDTPWGSRSKRALLRRPWTWPVLWWRQRTAMRELRRRVLAHVVTACPDVVLVPYPSHAAVHAVRAAWRGPLVADLFLSVYLTLTDGGGLVRAVPGLGAWLREKDRSVVRAADLVLLDTAEHAAAVARVCAVGERSFAAVPVGDPDAPAQVREPRERDDAPMRVLFFGTGVPLHGLPMWLDAAERDGGRSFELHLIGGRASDRARAERLPGVVVGPTFVDRDELGRRIDDADVVAGILGESAKADAVVPFKVVHALAHGRPVVTASTPATRAHLSSGEDCLLVERSGGTAALLTALAGLAADPGLRQRIGVAARARFDASFSSAALRSRLLECLARAMGRTPQQPAAAFADATVARPVEPMAAGRSGGG